ncbi:MAG: indolepyruvate oxidoreductase subunit beta, partial [Verrucomicrobia bacterium]|nr:indolepyruvate oxidoreductase subunit beta [Prolixibacteraceae bacterium]
MKADIILAGVGGQGILSIATVLGEAALADGHTIKQAETHGMSQRGGAVYSHMRISDQPVYSDLIPGGSADLILSVEPMESLRYLPFLSETGYLVTNITPFINIPNYPELEKVLEEIRKQPRFIAIDADA